MIALIFSALLIVAFFFLTVDVSRPFASHNDTLADEHAYHVAFMHWAHDARQSALDWDALIQEAQDAPQVLTHGQGSKEICVRVYGAPRYFRAATIQGALSRARHILGALKGEITRVCDKHPEFEYVSRETCAQNVRVAAEKGSSVALIPALLKWAQSLGYQDAAKSNFVLCMIAMHNKPALRR